jgi:AGZA family xanthine/uracil permease-like MFS transporter
MIAAMKQTGIMYQGLTVLGGGSILSGVILSATTVFIIDRDFMKAAGFAAAGGALTFFGLMHGEEVGAFQNPGVVAAYLAVAGVLFACGRFAVVAPAAAMSHHEEEEEKSFESTAEGELAPAK